MASGSDAASVASMRPPQNAGESSATVEVQDMSAEASMRPPQNAGESSLLTNRLFKRITSFNEAPAERGGKSRRSAGGVSFLAWLQ